MRSTLHTLLLATRWLGLICCMTVLAGLQVNMSIDPEGITLLRYFQIANFGTATEQSDTV